MDILSDLRTYYDTATKSDSTSWDHIVFTDRDIPQQDDHCNCGVYLLFFAYCEALNIVITKDTNVDIVDFRKRIAHVLYHKII